MKVGANSEKEVKDLSMYVYNIEGNLTQFMSLIAFLPESDVVSVQVEDLQRMLGIKHGDRIEVCNIYKTQKQ